MVGLDTLLVTGLLTLAANPVQCQVPRAPIIEVVPKAAPTAYDFTRSILDLQKIRSDTISPYGNHKEQLIFGLHRGKMELGYNIKFGGMEYPRLGLTCLYFDKIKITISLNPVIYVVNEFPSGSCEHNTVLEHERKHVATDRRIVNKYAREIGVEVQKAVNRAGALGPYRTSEIVSVRKRMSNHIRSAIKSMELNLYEEQTRAQQAVDSREEYDSISNKIHNVCGYEMDNDTRKKLRQTYNVR
jgi:hypothetical protein